MQHSVLERKTKSNIFDWHNFYVKLQQENIENCLIEILIFGNIWKNGQRTPQGVILLLDHQG